MAIFHDKMLVDFYILFHSCPLFMVNMYNIYKPNKIKEVIYQLLKKNL